MDVIERLSMFQRVICVRYIEVVHVSEGHLCPLYRGCPCFRGSSVDVIERLSCFRGSSVYVIERLYVFQRVICVRYREVVMFQRVVCGRYREVVHVSEGHLWTLYRGCPCFRGSSVDVIERLSCFRGSYVDVIERLSMFQRVICGRYIEVVRVSEGHL